MPLSAHCIWRQTACFVVAAVLAISASMGRAQSAEYQQKAAVIMGIVRATEWPASKLKADAPIVIGVYGSEIAADKLRESTAGRLLRGRTVVVKLLTATQEIEGCHVVFASISDDAMTRKILSQTKGDPILTFGETAEFTKKGGIFLLQSASAQAGALALRTFVEGDNLKRSKLKIDEEALISARVQPVPKR